MFNSLCFLCYKKKRKTKGWIEKRVGRSPQLMLWRWITDPKGSLLVIEFVHRKCPFFTGFLFAPFAQSPPLPFSLVSTNILFCTKIWSEENLHTLKSFLFWLLEHCHWITACIMYLYFELCIYESFPKIWNLFTVSYSFHLISLYLCLKIVLRPLNLLSKACKGNLLIQ